MRSGIRISGLLAALAGCASAFAAAPAAPPSYGITAIPTPANVVSVVPAAINTNGQITGTLTFAAGAPSHAFLYSQGTLSDLGTLNYPGSVLTGSATGQAINSAGAVVGTIAEPVSDAWSFGFEYNGGALSALTIASGYTNCTATGINSAGVIVGGCSNPGSFAAVYESGVPQAVGPEGGAASAINDSGQIAGYGASSGFIVSGSSGTVTNIPALAASSAVPTPTSINNAGQVVGWQAQNSLFAQFLYSVGATAALSSVPSSSVQPNPVINNAGQVLSGYTPAGGSATPFLLANDTLTNVNALISATDPNKRYVTIVNAYALNDNAWIAAAGVDSRTGLTAMYLLTPNTPWPTAVTVLAPASANTGVAFTVAWIDQSASSCVATGGSGSDGWKGNVSTHGGQMQITESAAATYDFTLTCKGTSGSPSSTAAVVVSKKAVPSFGGGGGALEPTTLALLLMLGAWRVLRLPAPRLRRGPAR